MHAATSGWLGWTAAGAMLAVRLGDLLAEFADAAGEDGSTLGRFAEPEGKRGRRAVSVFDQDAAGGFDALDAPAGVAEQDHVAGAGVDGEVLVERGDLYAFRLQYDAEQRGVGDGAAVRDSDGARAAARMKLAVDAVAEQVRAIAAARGFDAFAEQRDDLVEQRAREIAVRVGAAENGEERVFIPGFRGDTGDDLLHQHVNGLRRDFEPVQLARAQLADQGSLFQQVVAGGGEEAAFGDGSAPVAGAADPLHGDGDGAGAGDLADEVDVADVDSQLERGGRDEDAHLAVLQSLLSVEAEFAGERAVVRGDAIRAKLGGRGVRRARRRSSPPAGAC